jgi:beta-lactamase class A
MPRPPVALVVLAMLVSRAVLANPLADRVASLTKDFKGKVVLYAKHLETGREFALEPDTRVRTASTIKLPILCALESLTATGKVQWYERIVMRAADKVSGSGVMRALDDGTELTVRNLAVLMIVVSDNTATNLILDRVTPDAVNEYLDTIGLTQTRANRKIAGAATPSWSRAGQIEDNKRFGLGVSTPREMVRLLELLHQGRIVSAEASAHVLDVLKMQQVKAAIGRHAPRDWTVASKSGTLDALRSDVGIVYTKSGPIALAITVDEMPETDYSPDNVGENLIWDLTEALVSQLSKAHGNQGARGHNQGPQVQ